MKDSGRPVGQPLRVLFLSISVRLASEIDGASGAAFPIPVSRHGVSARRRGKVLGDLLAVPDYSLVSSPRLHVYCTAYIDTVKGKHEEKVKKVEVYFSETAKSGKGKGLRVEFFFG